MNKKDWIKNNLPTILTGVGCVGTLVTAGLAIRAGMKIADICSDEERFKVEASNGDEWAEIDVKSNGEYYVNYRISKKSVKKEVIKACMPVAIGSVVTIGCGISADILNRQQKSDLLAMCALIGSSYSGYRSEVIRRYGAEVDREITDCVAKSPEVCCMCPDIPDKKCHWIIDMCMDDLPKYELDAYERDIINAERHLNRNYIMCGEQSFGNFLEFLGFDVGKFANEMVFGWAINDSEIYYIDFVHTKIDENTFRLTPIFAPWYQFDRLDMWGEEY